MSTLLKRFPAAVLVLLTVGSSGVSGATTGKPHNTNALIQRGISPRILDVAVNPLSQGLGMVMLIEQTETDAEGEIRSERYRVRFDPFTSYGLELNAEIDAEPGETVHSKRAYKHMISDMLGVEYRLRDGDRLYSEISVETLEDDGEDAVIGFRYDRQKIPMGLGLRYLQHMSGRVHVVGGKLGSVEMTADRPVKFWGETAENLRHVVWFAESPGRGGYLVDSYEIEFEVRSRKQPVTWRIRGQVETYSGEHAEPVERDRREPIVSTEPFESSVPVKLNLKRTLPILGNGARKAGFILPKTYGIAAAVHAQTQPLEFKNLSVNGIDVGAGGAGLIEALGSGVEERSIYGGGRFDFWLLPFLNVDLLVGQLENETDVTLKLTEEGRDLIEILAGVDPGPTADFRVETSGTIVGLGLGTGFQYENLFGALQGQYVNTVTNETESEVEVIVSTLLVGYSFGDLDLRVMAGFQYQDWDQRITGQVDLGGGTPLEFDIEVDSARTTPLIGLNQGFARNWEFNAVIGLGTRQQVSAVLGYRF